MRPLAEAGNKVEMNFGNFSMAALLAVMVTYAQHPFFAGSGKWLLLHLVSERSGQLADQLMDWVTLSPHWEWVWVLHLLTGGAGHFCDSQTCISPGWGRGRLTTLLHTTHCQERSCQTIYLKSNELGVLWKGGIWLVEKVMSLGLDCSCIKGYF